MNIRVKFSVKVENPNYRYGDQCKSPWMEISGTGDLIAIQEQRALVCADSGKFYQVLFENLERVKNVDSKR